jgi:small subunit ribosomal protein S5
MGGVSIERLIDERRKEQNILEIQDQLQLEERLIYAKRTTRVTKGGKRFSFSALVIVGDKRGFVGFGLGKAREVPIAIAKAIEDGRKHIIRVPIIEGTVPPRCDRTLRSHHDKGHASQKGNGYSGGWCRKAHL